MERQPTTLSFDPTSKLNPNLMASAHRGLRLMATYAMLSSSVLSAFLATPARAEKMASVDRAISVLQQGSSSALQIQVTGLGSDTRAIFSVCEQTGSSEVQCQPIGRASGYSVSEIEAKERRAQRRAYESLALNIGAGLLGTVVAGAGSHALLSRTNPALLNGNAAQQLVGALAIGLGAGAGGGLSGGIAYMILRPDANFAARGLFRVARDGSVGVVVDDLPAVVDSVTSILMSAD